MKNPFFSVIIPVYNYALLVESAVYSVLDQGFDQLEIILIDDGSQDNSKQVCQNLVAEHPNKIQFISQDNQGAAAARNHGIRLAKGEYLLFLDADDEMCSEAFEQVSCTIKQKTSKEKIVDAVIGGHQANNIDKNGIGSANEKPRYHSPGRLAKSKKERARDYLIDKKIRISNGAIFIHRSVFERGLFPESFRNSEDIPVFMQALCSEHVIALDKPLVVVNKHNDSLRHQTEAMVEGGMALVDEVFNEQRISQEVLCCKPAYRAQRALSLMRSLYLAKQYQQALHFYKIALQEKPLLFFRWPYTRKAIKSFFKS